MPRLCWLALIRRLLIEPISGVPSNLGLVKVTCPGPAALLVGAVVVCMDTTFKTEELDAKPDTGPDVGWPVSWLIVAVLTAVAAFPPTLWGGNRGACSKYMMPDLDLLMMLGTVRCDEALSDPKSNRLG